MSSCPSSRELPCQNASPPPGHPCQRHASVCPTSSAHPVRHQLSSQKAVILKGTVVKWPPTLPTTLLPTPLLQQPPDFTCPFQTVLPTTAREIQICYTIFLPERNPSVVPSVIRKKSRLPGMTQHLPFPYLYPCNSPNLHPTCQIATIKLLKYYPPAPPQA